MAREQEEESVDQRRLLLILLLVARLAESSGEPLETLVKTVSRGGAGGLDVLFGDKGQHLGW